MKELHRKTNVEAICQKRCSVHVASRAVMCLAWKKTDLSLNEIGKFFGRRHYTAISVAFRRVEQRRQSHAAFDKELPKIAEEIP